MNNSSKVALILAFSFMLIAAVIDCASIERSNKDLKDSIVTSLKKQTSKQDDENPFQIDDDSLKVSVILQTLLPSMFNLFSNITDSEYKSRFKDPCKFDSLLEIFSKLPPYFDIIGKKYPRNPELVAYYSMQLASTFLVNNGSLTMECLYNMLSLQTRLHSFSLKIMDTPEQHFQLVGLFGVFMKPVMAKLKQNSMMKIIEHVDKYDKNDDLSTVTLFHIFNVVFVLISIIGILSNILLIILLKRSSVVKKTIVFAVKSTNNSKYSSRTSRSKSKQLNHSHAQNGSLKRYHHSSKSATVARSHSASNPRHKSPMTHNQRIANNYDTTIRNGTYRNSNRLSGEHLDYQQKAELMPLSTNLNEQLSHTLNYAEPLSPPSRMSHKKQNIYVNHSEIVNHSLLQHGTLQKRQKRTKTSTKPKRTRRSAASYLFLLVRRRYKTRICFILIAICHSLYLLMNFIVMSQASIASFALKGLNELNIGCKISFFLFPPTTAYNILHQFAIWLLVYAIKAHSSKLRKTRAMDLDIDDEFENDSLAKTTDDSDESRHMIGEEYINEEYEADEKDTLSMTLTNNSTINHQNLPIKSSMKPNGASINSSASIGNSQQQVLGLNRHHVLPANTVSTISRSQLPATKFSNGYLSNFNNANFYDYKVKKSSDCNIFSYKRKNLFFCIFLFILLCIYNSQNIVFYSLAQLTDMTKNKPLGETLYYCAFDEHYAYLFQLLNQYVIPLANLTFFAILPLIGGALIVLFDLCFLYRISREQPKDYERLKKVIEWPLYAYFATYLVSQLPFALHQIVDLSNGTVKFPFVFPIFIHMKFTSKVGLVIFEMLLMCLAYSADLYLWMWSDKEMRRVITFWLSKRILCRTYKHSSSSATSSSTSSSKKSPTISTSSNSGSGGNGSGSTCSRSSGFSDSNSNAGGVAEIHQNEVKSRLQITRHVKYSPTASGRGLLDVQVTNSHLQASNEISESTNINNTNSCASSTISTSITMSSATNSQIQTTSNAQREPKKHKAIESLVNTAKNTASISALQMAASNDSHNHSLATTSSGSSTPSSPVKLNTDLLRAEAPEKNIRMIDTDIDEVDDNDISERCLNGNESFYAQKHQQQPPSFDSAVTNEENGRNHQYQNTSYVRSFVNSNKK